MFSIPMLSLFFVGALQIWDELFGNKRQLPIKGMHLPTAKLQFGVFQDVFEPLAVMATVPVMQPLARLALPVVKPLAKAKAPMLQPLAAVAQPFADPLEAMASMSIVKPFASAAAAPLLRPIALAAMPGVGSQTTFGPASSWLDPIAQSLRSSLGRVAQVPLYVPLGAIADSMLEPLRAPLNPLPWDHPLEAENSARLSFSMLCRCALAVATGPAFKALAKLALPLLKRAERTETWPLQPIAPLAGALRRPMDAIAGTTIGKPLGFIATAACLKSLANLALPSVELLAGPAAWSLREPLLEVARVPLAAPLVAFTASVFYPLADLRYSYLRARRGMRVAASQRLTVFHREDEMNQLLWSTEELPKTAL
jgi:hypothetical protein